MKKSILISEKMTTQQLKEENKKLNVNENENENENKKIEKNKMVKDANIKEQKNEKR